MTEENVDIRQLNYIRLTLMKEDKVSFSVFAKQASKIFKRPDFPESELATMMKEMLQQGQETSNNEDTKSVMSGVL